MGRPSLKVKATMVRLPEGTEAEIDRLMGGKHRRAEFIREAVEREIKRRSRTQSPKP